MDRANKNITFIIYQWSYLVGKVQVLSQILYFGIIKAPVQSEILLKKCFYNPEGFLKSIGKLRVEMKNLNL